MKFRLRVSILELFLVTTAAAFSIALLISGTPIASHIAVTVEVLLLVVFITLATSATAGRLRCLVAYIATALVSRVFLDYGDWAPFELIHERVWSAIAQRGNDPPLEAALTGPRPEGLISFLDTARPLTG